MSYAWVPAGCIPGGIVNAYIYIRFGKTGVDRPTVVHDWSGPQGYSHIKMPDRDVFLAHEFSRRRPLDQNIDLCINTDIFRAGGYGEKYLGGYALISAHHGMQPSVRCNSRYFISSKKIQIIGDSGGAQLKLGSADYVDPHKVISWHNKVVDIGACLDVPPRPVDHNNPKVLKALMEVQRRNNVIFKEAKREDLKLLNVNHGYTLQQQRDWAAHVADDSFYGWAAGADNYGSDFSNFRSLIVAAKEFGGKHFHLFGVSGRKRAPPVAWIGKHLPTVTTDSTSYLVGVRSRDFLYITPNGSMEKLSVGDNCDFTQNKGANLYVPCNCEACFALKHWETYALPSNTGVAALLAWHNMIVTSQYTRLWNHLAQTLSLEEYIKVIHKAFRHVKGAAKSIADMVRYVDSCFTESIDTAEKRFEPVMGNQPVAIGSMKPLFAQGKEKLESLATNLVQRDSAGTDTLLRYLSPEDLASFGIAVPSTSVGNNVSQVP